jgi:hypothetical protein
MASEINYASIDETYPIAGKDNDSQGFRDNFGYIKNGLITASSEITDLQSNTAKTNSDSSFNNYQISQARFINCGNSLHDGGIVGNSISPPTVTLSYTDGSIQIFELSSNVTFLMSGFPPVPQPGTNTAGYLRVQLISQNSSSFNATFSVNGGTIKRNTSTVPSTTVTITSATNPMIFDFWSYDGGVNVFMDYVGTFSV